MCQHSFDVATIQAGAAAPRRPSALLRQDLSTAGLIEKARAEARRTLTALAGDAPVVGLEPSCLMTLRDEFVSQFRRWRLFARCKKAVGIRPAGLRSGALGDIFNFWNRRCCSRLALNLGSGAAFVFRGKRGDYVKIFDLGRFGPVPVLAGRRAEDRLRPNRRARTAQAVARKRQP